MHGAVRGRNEWRKNIEKKWNFCFALPKKLKFTFDCHRFVLERYSDHVRMINDQFYSVYRNHNTTCIRSFGRLFLYMYIKI